MTRFIHFPFRFSVRFRGYEYFCPSKSESLIPNAILLSLVLGQVLARGARFRRLGSQFIVHLQSTGNPSQRRNNTRIWILVLLSLQKLLSKLYPHPLLALRIWKSVHRLEFLMILATFLCWKLLPFCKLSVYPHFISMIGYLMRWIIIENVCFLRLAGKTILGLYFKNVETYFELNFCCLINLSISSLSSIYGCLF